MHWKRNGWLIRPAQAADAQDYYHALFDPLDPEAAYFTGSESHFPKDVVIPFFLRCIADETRHDFLIIRRETLPAKASSTNTFPKTAVPTTASCSPVRKTAVAALAHGPFSAPVHLPLNT